MAATFIQEFEGAEDDLIRPIDHTLADTQIGVGYGVTTLPHLRNLAIVGPMPSPACPTTRRGEHLHLPSDGADRSGAVRPAHSRTAGDAGVSAAGHGR